MRSLGNLVHSHRARGQRPERAREESAAPASRSRLAGGRQREHHEAHGDGRQRDDDSDDATVEIIGGGTDRPRLEALARERGLDNIRFLDAQPVEFVSRLYSIAWAGFASLKKLPLLGSQFFQSVPNFPEPVSGQIACRHEFWMRRQIGQL